MSHIFISYSTRNKEFANHLRELLLKAGFNVWMDKHDLKVGMFWWQEIQRAIKECYIFILLESPDAQKSRFVRDELRIAINHNKPVLPFTLYCKIRKNLSHIQYEEILTD